MILGLEHSLQGRHGLRASRSRFERMFHLCNRLDKAVVVARQHLKLGKRRGLIALLEQRRSVKPGGCGTAIVTTHDLPFGQKIVEKLRGRRGLSGAHQGLGVTQSVGERAGSADTPLIKRQGRVELAFGVQFAGVA